MEHCRTAAHRRVSGWPTAPCTAAAALDLDGQSSEVVRTSREALEQAGEAPPVAAGG